MLWNQCSNGFFRVPSCGTAVSAGISSGQGQQVFLEWTWESDGQWWVFKLKIPFYLIFYKLFRFCTFQLCKQDRLGFFCLEIKQGQNSCGLFINLLHVCVWTCVPSVCLTDQISCGCCLMQQKIDRMKTYFDTKLNEFEKDLAKTDDALTSAKGRRMSVYRLEQFGCILILASRPACLCPLCVQTAGRPSLQHWPVTVVCSAMVPSAMKGSSSTRTSS